MPWLPVAVEGKRCASALSVGLVCPGFGHSNGLFGRGSRQFELTDLGVGGGERAYEVGLLRLSELAGALGEGDGFSAIANAGIRMSGKQPCQIVEGGSELRIQADRFAIGMDRSRFILLFKNESKEEVKLRFARLKLQGSLIMGGSFAEISTTARAIARVPPGEVFPRKQSNGRIDPGVGFSNLPVSKKLRGEVIKRDDIRRRDALRVREKGKAVFPNPYLTKGEEAACQERRAGPKRQGQWREAKRFHKIAHAPDDRDEQADGWEVHVTICDGLAADLHEADDRNECAEKPEPAGEKVRTVPHSQHGQSADAK